MRVRFRWLEICGFRSFGPVATRLSFDSPLGVISAPNSQGKTNIAEALEFLLTGDTTRREFLASAKAEFDGCLRNVYIQSGSRVFVRAGLEAESGRTYLIERRLESDYSTSGNCTSVLTIDGAESEGLEEIGIQLAVAPMQAPVLMQHTLRYALSAKPQERTDYFKAVLEVQDLETVRDELKSLHEVLQTKPSLQVVLDRCSENPQLKPQIDNLLRLSPIKRKVVEAALSEMARIGLRTYRIPVREDSSLGERTEQLRTQLGTFRESVFPVSQLEMEFKGDFERFQAEFPSLTNYNKRISGFPREAVRFQRLFRAVLDTVDLASISEPMNCPVCNTAKALDKDRFAEIERYLDNLAELEKMQQSAVQELKTIAKQVQNVRNQLGVALPGAATWDAVFRAAQEKAIAEVVAPKTLSEFGQLLDALQEQDGERTKAMSHVETIDSILNDGRVAIGSLESFPDTSLKKALHDLNAVLADLNSSRRKTRGEAERVLAPISEAIDSVLKVTVLRELIDVVSDPQRVVETLVEVRAQDITRAELSQALSEVESAKARILDENFEALSAEISEWWNLMRPQERVTFRGIRRRGSGRRFMRFKAALKRVDGDSTEERDAVAVFSDSQLNCLGLSAFLARWARSSAGFIVLDDPVIASDEGHINTFARYVVERLLESQLQVIIATHQEELSRTLGDLYQHVPVEMFTVSLEDPVVGSKVVRTSDQLKALLDRASPFIRSPEREMRKTGAGNLRDAAERFCKELITQQRRAKGEQCSIADYDGKTLGQLIDLVTPYLSDPSHPGKLKALNRNLAPGLHDDKAPNSDALVVAFGDLKYFRKHYLSGGSSRRSKKGR